MHELCFCKTEQDKSDQVIGPELQNAILKTILVQT